MLHRKKGRGALGLLFFYLPLLFGCQKNPQIDSLFNVVGCDIYSEEGALFKSYPGEFCVFLEDGSFISSQERQNIFGDASQISRIDSNGKLVWRREIPVRHQMKLAENKKDILFVSYTLSNVYGRQAAYESFVRLSLDGYIVQRFNSDEHLEALDTFAENKELHVLFSPLDWKYLPIWEYSRANAIYEIPENSNEGKIPGFERGNYIVTYNRKNFIAILDKDLKKVLWGMHVENYRYFHDAQILPSGHVLLYNNSSNARPNILLQIFEPISKKLVWEFGRDENEFYQSSAQGGVQILDEGKILFSANDPEKGGRIVVVDWLGNKISEFPTRLDSKTKIPMDIQEVKRMNIGGFLKNSRI